MRKTALLAGALALVLALPGAARAQDPAPDKTVSVAAPPTPASRPGALWAALASADATIALEDVLAVSGYAFRATDCADDCPCIESREDALSVAPTANAFGWTDTVVDLAKASVDAGFAAIKESIGAGRAPFYFGPGEVGVVSGVKENPRTFFVHALLGGSEAKDEARPAEALADLWELHTLVRAKTPALEPTLRDHGALLQAVAHAHRVPVRGGCGFLDPPALNGWGLAAFPIFAQRLATNDRGIAGAHTAVAERAAHLRAGRAAAVGFLTKAAQRREAMIPGSGAALTAAAREYKAELDQALVPLDALTAGKDETAYVRDAFRRQAAGLLMKAAEHEKAALLLLEGPAFAGRFSKEVAAALSLARTSPVPETLAADLVPLLQTGEADVRLLAATALCDTPGPAARAALARALTDKDGPVSEAALVALEARNEPGLVDLLLDAWDKAPRLRVRSERPLQRQLVFSLADHAATDPRAKKALERALEDQGEGDEVPDAIPRWAAACLYEVEGVDAEPVLLATMKSSRPTARRAAAEVLDLSGSKDALAALDAALGDPDPALRLLAASALGRRGVEKGLQAALSALKDPSREVRSLGVESLTRIGAPALGPLVKLLDDKDWRVRANACVVLGRTGTTAELKKIAALETDSAPPVRELALEAKAVIEARAKAEEKTK
jgi:HEAT repeat protein